MTSDHLAGTASTAGPATSAPRDAPAGPGAVARPPGGAGAAGGRARAPHAVRAGAGSVVTDDAVVGPLVRGSGEDGVVRVHGPAVPDVEIRRTGPSRRRDVPIGTRVAENLTMHVDGTGVRLLPRPGAFSRRSYAVRVVGAQVDLLLTPRSPTSSHLVRGRRARWLGASDVLGDLEVLGGELLPARWAAVDPDTPEFLRPHAPVPTPTEVAVGHALATAFGTGARLMLFEVVDRLLDSGVEPPGL